MNFTYNVKNLPIELFQSKLKISSVPNFLWPKLKVRRSNDVCDVSYLWRGHLSSS